MLGTIWYLSESPRRSPCVNCWPNAVIPQARRLLRFISTCDLRGAAPAGGVHDAGADDDDDDGRQPAGRAVAWLAGWLASGRT